MVGKIHELAPFFRGLACGFLEFGFGAKSRVMVVISKLYGFWDYLVFLP
jgi:hypothetical protein